MDKNIQDKGHENKYLENPLNPKDINFFHNDPYLIFLYKKTEKLSSALYLVTNLFPDQEPVKWDLRHKGLCLLNTVLVVSHQSLSDKELHLNKISELILSVVAMLNVALSVGLISPMNHAILLREFTSLLTLIETKEKNEKEQHGYVLSNHFFESVEKFTPETAAPLYTPGDAGQSAGPHFKGQKKVQGHNEGIVVTHSNSKTQGNTSDVKDILQRKDSRKNSIIALLKKESNLTIKDFAKVIPGCSEKTIQRELLHLVSDGVLKKEGERRWSTYSLA